MGQTAEVLARKLGNRRHEQDAYALASHERATRAAEEGYPDQEIVAVMGPPHYDHAQLHDDGPRPAQSLEALARLRPYFDRHAGTVTAGNTCPLTDGAVALLVSSEEKARQLGITPLGFLNDWAFAALDGRRRGPGLCHRKAPEEDRPEA